MLSPFAITDEDVKDIARLSRELLGPGRKLSKQDLIVCARTSYVYVARVWQENGKGRIVGMASVDIQHLPASGCNGSIEDVIVAHQYRHRGIGTILIQNVVDLAREKGATEICVVSNGKWVEGHALYGKIGLKENRKVKVFELQLK